MGQHCLNETSKELPNNLRSSADELYCEEEGPLPTNNHCDPSSLSTIPSLNGQPVHKTNHLLPYVHANELVCASNILDLNANLHDFSMNLGIDIDFSAENVFLAQSIFSPLLLSTGVKKSMLLSPTA